MTVSTLSLVRRLTIDSNPHTAYIMSSLQRIELLLTEYPNDRWLWDICRNLSHDSIELTASKWLLTYNFKFSKIN